MKIEKNFNDKKIVLSQGDITDLKTDAIVNAANDHLWMGSGVAGAIKAKGGVEIEKEAIAKGPIQIGEAIVTTAGNLKAKYVIHAAVMGQDLQTNEKYIRDATLNSLKRAEELNLSSIAFPALGTGVGGFPIDKCADLMISTTVGFFRDNQHVKEVHFALFRKNDFDVFTLVLEKVWNDFQWNLKWIQAKQQFFCSQSEKVFEEHFKLLNEAEEILIQAMNLSRGFYQMNKDKNFNDAFMRLSSYIIEDSEAIKELTTRSLFTCSSILLRHVDSCHLHVMFLRNYPEYINEWLEESKKSPFSKLKDLNPIFSENKMRKKLEEKGEKIDYDLFNVSSKRVHGSPIWSLWFSDFNLFESPSQRLILGCKAVLATFSELLRITVGEFLKKYQSEINTHDDLKKLGLRYVELSKKHEIFINNLNREINNTID